MITQLFSAALAFAPPTARTPPDFESPIEHTEIIGGEGDAQLIAYDAAGEILGMIAIWIDSDGRIHLASDYGDGYAETVVTGGEAQTEATLPPEVIESRSAAMLASIHYIEGNTEEQESWTTCAISTVGAVGACAGGVATGGLALAACPAGAAWAACECLPMLVQKWRDKSCSD